MNNIINQNLDEIISIKNQLSNVLLENGVEAGSYFSEYPSLFRSVIASGGGSIDEETLYSYIGDYLDSYNYIDQDSLSSNSYVTSTALENASYATQSYVMDKIGAIPSTDLSSYLCIDNLTKPSGFNTLKLWDTGLSVSTVNGKIYPDWLSYSSVAGSSYNYSFISCGTLKNYVNGRLVDIESTYATTSQIPEIDENLIPKETNTYTLGNSSYIYNNTYSRSVNLGTGVRIFSESSASSNDIAVELGGVSYYYINTNRIAPNGSANSGILDLGTSDRKWNNVYANHYNFSSYNSIDESTSSRLNFKINQYNRYKMTNTEFAPYTNKGVNLGTSTEQFNKLYCDTAYISNYNNLIWTGTAAQYAALSDYTTYQFYLVQES